MSQLWPELLSLTACRYVQVRTGGARAGPSGVSFHFGGVVHGRDGVPARPDDRAGADSLRWCPHVEARPAPRCRDGFGLGGSLVLWSGAQFPNSRGLIKLRRAVACARRRRRRRERASARGPTRAYAPGVSACPQPAPVRTLTHTHRHPNAMHTRTGTRTRAHMYTNARCAHVRSHSCVRSRACSFPPRPPPSRSSPVAPPESPHLTLNSAGGPPGADAPHDASDVVGGPPGAVALCSTRRHRPAHAPCGPVHGSGRALPDGVLSV